MVAHVIRIDAGLVGQRPPDGRSPARRVGRSRCRSSASRARDDRPGLKACLDYFNAGDTLIVWKFDRLGRLLPHLLTINTDLNARGIAFRSLTEQIDTTTPHGESLFSVFGAPAEYERALTRERVMAGWPQPNAGGARVAVRQ
ncbi:recombinase family protein [Glacieibacterium megasporae]|uniref:recombinase family protein n=1 Tax=Glacieibacterium megasporae TaxID=2835787 RepID=UPI003F71C0E7